MQVAIYARTSRDDPKDLGSKSIPDQISDCLKLCKENGHTITSPPDGKAYIDKNKSGRFWPSGMDDLAKYDLPLYQHFGEKKVQEREGLGRLLSRLDEIDAIVVRDLTRLMRPLQTSMLFGRLIGILNKHGVKIITLEGILDPDKDEDVFFKLLNLAITSNDVVKRTQYSRTKLSRLKDEGKVASNPSMYGYRTAGKQKVRIVPREAEVVMRIFRMSLGGWSSFKIAKKLNDEGVPTQTEPFTTKDRKPKRGWSPNRVIKILSHPQYFGFQFNSRKNLIESKVYPSLSDDKDLTIDVWKLIRSRKRKRKRFANRIASSPTHELSGIIRCGFCKSNMAVNATSDTYAPAGYRFYCPNAPNFSLDNHSVKGCRLAAINESYLTEFFEELLKPLYLIRHDLLRVAEGISSKSELPQMKDEFEQFNIRLDSLFDNKDDFSDQEFQRQVARLTESRSILEDKIAELELQPDDLVRVPFYCNSENFRDVFDSIEVYALQVRIVLWNGFDFTVERVPDRNTRKMPPIESLNPELEGNKALMKLSYKTCLKGKDSSERVITDSDFIKLISVGLNPLPYEGSRKWGKADVPEWPDYVLKSEVPSKPKLKKKKGKKKKS